VIANDDIGGSTRMLCVKPDGHDGFTFEPGQFAWLVTGRTTLWSQQHPLSICSSAEIGVDGAIEFSVKALGDWSGQVVPGLEPGSRVWVEGPFGAFTIDRAVAQGFVMIAGGIGIAPMRSMLLTMRDRGDRRHVVLVYAAHDPSRLVFTEELAALRQSLSLEVIYVLEAPGHWRCAEHGHLTQDLLARHLPRQFRQYHFFVCGPSPMMNDVEAALRSLGVPVRAIDSERFNVV
jgi:predicted ferric reductase